MIGDTGLDLTYPRDCAYGLRLLTLDIVASCAAAFFALLSGLSEARTRALLWLANCALADASAPVGVKSGESGVRSGVQSPGVLGVACRSRLLMSSARSFVAASSIESTPIIGVR